MTQAASRDYGELTPARRRAIVSSILLANFLAAMEVTVVSTAMPTVIAKLGGLERYSWVFTAYILTSTVSLPLWGKLSDLYGRRRLLLLSLVVFLVGSLLSGLSQDFGQLVAFRALQGLGAGGLAPLGMTVIGEIYTASERARMQGVFSSVWGVSSVAGPLIGGLLTDQLSWRWVFFINLPVGLVAMAMIHLVLPRLGHRQRVRVDWAGAMTLTLGVALLLLGTARIGETHGRVEIYGVALLLASVLATVAFVGVERTAADPIIPLHLFRIGDVRIPLLCALLAGMALFSAMTFIPMFVQGVTGSTATEAGFALTPFLLGWVVMSIVAGRLALVVPLRWLGTSGFALLTVGFVLLQRFGEETPRSYIYADMALMGVGMGTAMLILLLLIQTVVPARHLGVATSLNVFFRSVGGAIGVAVLGAVLTASFLATLADSSLVETAARLDLSELNANAVLDPRARAELPAEELHALEGALARGLRRVFAAGSVLAAMAAFAALGLPRHDLTEVERRASHLHSPLSVESESSGS